MNVPCLRRRQIRKDIMRIASMVLAMMVLIVLATGACSQPDMYPTSQGPSTTAHTPPKLGDTLSAWGITMFVTVPVHYFYESTTLFVGMDKEAWVVIAEIRNTGSKDFQYNLSCWEGTDQDNHLYSASVSFRQTGLTEGTIPPGGTAGGYVGFVLPKGSTLASVTFRPIGTNLDPKYLAW
jgi:hypothetical protein